uniref:Uncharacterized protein n=1 Tax=Cacopsylla melanoneura TaxID=428564 RepID=A0A8D9E1J0_9HEMI
MGVVGSWGVGSVSPTAAGFGTLHSSILSSPPPTSSSFCFSSASTVSSPEHSSVTSLGSSLTSELSALFSLLAFVVFFFLLGFSFLAGAFGGFFNSFVSGLTAFKFSKIFCLVTIPSEYCSVLDISGHVSW